MSDVRDKDRNPLLIPTEKPAPKPRKCPYCGGSNFAGFSSSGYLTMRCNDCGGEWMGGVGRVPQDPTVPHPPLDPRDRPTVDFARNDKTGEVEEIRRRPDYTQSFRRGAPLPEPGEDDNG